MTDNDEIASMVDHHVPANPYWLVSIKPAESHDCEEIRFHKVEDQSGQVLPEAET